MVGYPGGDFRSAEARVGIYLGSGSPSMAFRVSFQDSANVPSVNQ